MLPVDVATPSCTAGTPITMPLNTALPAYSTYRLAGVVHVIHRLKCLRKHLRGRSPLLTTRAVCIFGYFSSCRLLIFLPVLQVFSPDTIPNSPHKCGRARLANYFVFAAICANTQSTPRSADQCVSNADQDEDSATGHQGHKRSWCQSVVHAASRPVGCHYSTEVLGRQHCLQRYST